MKKLVRLLGLVALFCTPVVAQDTPAAPQEQAPAAPAAPTEPVKVKRTYATPKADISAGFTHRPYYAIDGSTVGMNGIYGSFDYNFFRWLGVEAEGLGVGGTLKIPVLPPESLRVYTMLFGPRIYPLGHKKFAPFGHFLYGAGISTSSVPAFAGFPGNSDTTVVHAWEAGGGLDYNRWQHWGIRLIQADYAAAKFLGSTVPNQGSFRISFGIVYRFGEK